MLVPGVTDEWSVRDLLAHIAGYERYVSALIFGELEGRTPTNQDFYGRDDPPTPEDDANDDTSNAWVVAHARAQPLQATLDEYRWAHDRMIRAVEACSDADLEDPKRSRRSMARRCWRSCPASALAITASTCRS